jgi:hypothetical protein
MTSTLRKLFTLALLVFALLVFRSDTVSAIDSCAQTWAECQFPYGGSYNQYYCDPEPDTEGHIYCWWECCQYVCWYGSCQFQ